MDREKIILLRILLFVLLIPFLIFINYNLTNIKTDKQLLSRYRNIKEDVKTLQTEIIALQNEEKSLESSFQDSSSVFFSESEIKFYEFCDFIINSASNRGVKIENYSTNESAAPKRINLSATGQISNILMFLQYLDSFEKKIDINQLSIGYNSNDNEYRLSMLINFITIKIDDEDKE